MYTPRPDTSKVIPDILKEITVKKQQQVEQEIRASFINKWAHLCVLVTDCFGLSACLFEERTPRSPVMLNMMPLTNEADKCPSWQTAALWHRWPETQSLASYTNWEQRHESDLLDSSFDS